MFRVDVYEGIWGGGGGEYPVSSPCEGLCGSVLFFTSTLRCHVTLHKLAVFTFCECEVSVGSDE